MLHLHDRAALLAAPSLALEPELSMVLANRVRHLEAAGLIDLTEFVVVDAATTEAEVIQAIGWWPLRDIDGHLYGESEFVQPFDYVYRASEHYTVGVQTVGNTGFAFEMIVSTDACADLNSVLRRRYVA